MKTIFDPLVREAFIQRIGALDDKSMPAWGKMNVYQMLRHCTRWEEMIHNNEKVKRVFIGRLFGGWFLAQALKDESPMARHSPTIPELKIKETAGDVEAEKAKWMALVRQYESYCHPDYSYVHPFFGEMTKEQIGYHCYKHTDHHLRQFGC